MTMRLTERGHVFYAESLNDKDSGNSSTHRFTAVLGDLPENFPISAGEKDNWDDNSHVFVPDSLSEPVAYYMVSGGSGGEDELEDNEILNIVRVEDIDATNNPQLPSNGDFSGGITDWNGSGAALTSSSSVLRVTNSGAAASVASQNLNLDAGWYYLRCKLKSGGSGYSVSVDAALSTDLGSPYQEYKTQNSDYTEEVSFYFEVAADSSTVRIGLKVNGTTSGDYGEFELVEVHPLSGTPSHTNYELERNSSGINVINWGTGSGPSSGSSYRIWYWRKNSERRTIFNELVRKVVGESSYVVRDVNGTLDIGSVKWSRVDYPTRYLYLKFEFGSDIDDLDSITADTTQFYQVGIFSDAVTSDLTSTLISLDDLDDPGVLFMVDYIKPIPRTAGTVNTVETVVQN